QIAQRGRRGERAVDERAAAALRGDLPAHEHSLPPRFENGLDGGGDLPRPHEVAGRTTTQKQADRADEHGLARAGFAGQYIEARPELDLDRIDHRELANSEEAQHEGR